MADSGRKRPARTAASAAGETRERIVDCAIGIAEEVGWNGVRLREVADRAGMPLAALQSHYRDLDAVADGWFARATRAMLAPPPRRFATLPAQERLYLLLMRWFEALAPHRKVTAQMLREKLYPSHPHHWVPMIFNLSRTIQWLRDAALLDAGGRRRQLEEVGLTALFLATVAVWCRDDTADQARTRAFLRRRLASADRAAVALWGVAPPPEKTRRRAASGRRGSRAAPRPSSAAAR